MSYFNTLWLMPKPEQRWDSIEVRIKEASYDIPNLGGFSAVTATTNAVGWGVDVDGDFECEPPDDELRIPLTLEAKGLQLEDKFFYGDRIRGTVDAVINDDGEVSFENFELRVVD
jgi:hypothetical protein